MPGTNNARKVPILFENRNILTNKDIMIQHKTGICFSPSVYIQYVMGVVIVKVTCLLYHNSKSTCCAPSMQLDRPSLRLGIGNSLIVTYRARPPADFWCKMQFAFLFVAAPFHREEGKAVLWKTSHTFRFCQLQAGLIKLQ